MSQRELCTWTSTEPPLFATSLEKLGVVCHSRKGMLALHGLERIRIDHTSSILVMDRMVSKRLVNWISTCKCPRKPVTSPTPHYVLKCPSVIDHTNNDHICLQISRNLTLFY